MSAAPKYWITPQQYLELEQKSPFRNEYWNGRLYAMAGASGFHARIESNFVSAANHAFSDGPCYCVSSNLKVKVTETGLYTYPDASILCEEMQIENNNGDVLLNPKIIVEVLSPTTAGYDLGNKFTHYKNIPSFREYVLISQERPQIDRYHRNDDNISWTLMTYVGLDLCFEFKSIAVSIPMRSVYRGIIFEENDILTEAMIQAANNNHNRPA